LDETEHFDDGLFFFRPHFYAVILEITLASDILIALTYYVSLSCPKSARIAIDKYVFTLFILAF
jgi:hypothetical protein